MRIADNFFLPKPPLRGALTAVIFAFGVCSLSPVCAQEAQPFKLDAASGTASSLAPSPMDPVSIPAKADVSSDSVSEAPKSKSMRKNISAMEDKAVAAAKTTIKRLDAGSDVTTLEDLNMARQTVTRIEAMIELEKRLKELDKLRGASRSSYSSEQMDEVMPSPAMIPQIPASSIAPPAVTALPEPVAPISSSSRPEIAQIYGTGGKYSAVLKFSDTEKRIVRVGDKINDDETVMMITSSTVVIGGKKKSYVLPVKNGGLFYNAMR